jgi:hypothetical protein
MLCILTEEHLDVMNQFWEDTKTDPRKNRFSADVAYVLPTDFGYGFRGPEDNIWGLWLANVTSRTIWNQTNRLLERQGMNLDIVYETKIDVVPFTLPYETLVFWNQTTVE